MCPLKKINTLRIAHPKGSPEANLRGLHSSSSMFKFGPSRTGNDRTELQLSSASVQFSQLVRSPACKISSGAATGVAREAAQWQQKQRRRKTAGDVGVSLVLCKGIPLTDPGRRQNTCAAPAAAAAAGGRCSVVCVDAAWVANAAMLRGMRDSGSNLPDCPRPCLD